MTVTDPPPFLKLIAHTLRWQILQVLANSDLTVQEITAVLGQPQNLVSFHLHKLHQAQLILEHQSIADARQVYYGLNFPMVDELFQSLGELLHPALANPPMRDAKKLENVRVLFLCTHNSARSQMAEGILRAQSHNQIQVFSAGTDPLAVHPLAVRVMAEQGIDLRQATSKSLDQFRNQSFDYIITVCDRAREKCPIFPGNPARIHWSIPDPTEASGTAEERYKAFKEVAGQLTRRTRYLLKIFS